MSRPADSIFVLISDLYEGGVRDEMLKRVAQMKADGVQVVVLLALSDEGAPAFDREIAAALAGLGVPAFACTPDAFPDLLAVAISRGDIIAAVDNFFDAPAGGGGKGAARCTIRSAAWSSLAEPELRAIDSPASPPLPPMRNATTAVPRLPTRGRGTREIFRITCPG